LKIDDTLDVFAVHGIGGIFGILMMPFFSMLGFDNGSSWASQFTSLIVVGGYTIIVTAIIIKVLMLIIPIRVDREVEYEGLDINVHGERAYDLSS